MNLLLLLQRTRRQASPRPRPVPDCPTATPCRPLPQHLESLLSERTRVVSVVHVSNMLGCITDMAAVARMAHKVGPALGWAELAGLS